jgi:hypothetical protein
MADSEKREETGASITAPIIETAGRIAAPLRTVALVALGGTALIADAARRRVMHAADEGERQLELFSRSVRRTTARFWQRRGPQAAASSDRGARTRAAS